MAETDRHRVIHILFGYIEAYERGENFVVEEFINYFENVLSHLRLVRDQNNLEIIKAVDNTLIMHFDKVPFTTPRGGTDVRYFTAHILATLFTILLPMSSQFHSSYGFCLKLRQKKSDLDFIELELVPHLFDKDILKNIDDLRYYFLAKVAEMQNLFNHPMLIDDPGYQDFDKLLEIPMPMLFLYLVRRQLMMNSKSLLQDKNSPEYKLLEYGAISRLADSYQICKDILHKMGYLEAEVPFIDRVKQVISNAFEFITGIIKVPRYAGYIYRKSSGNYICFTVTVVVIIVILFGVFQWLGNYNGKKLKNFEQKIESLDQARY